MFGSSARMGVSAYRTVAVDTRSADNKADWVFSLLDGVLDQLAKAESAIQSGNVNAKCAAVSKATQIIDEGLRLWLDKQAGGELAQRLETLYDFCITTLVDANMRNDIKPIIDVRRVITQLAAGWQELARQIDQPGAATQAASQEERMYA